MNQLRFAAAVRPSCCEPSLSCCSLRPPLLVLCRRGSLLAWSLQSRLLPTWGSLVPRVRKVVAIGAHTNIKSRALSHQLPSCTLVVQGRPVRGQFCEVCMHCATEAGRLSPSTFASLYPAWVCPGDTFAHLSFASIIKFIAVPAEMADNMAALGDLFGPQLMSDIENIQDEAGKQTNAPHDSALRGRNLRCNPTGNTYSCFSELCLELCLIFMGSHICTTLVHSSNVCAGSCACICVPILLAHCR